MGWFYFDFECESCDMVFEVLVSGNDPEATEPCPHCGEPAKKIVGGTSNFWSNDKEKVSEMLRKRSIEHTKREQKKGNMLSPRDLIDK